MGVTLLPGPPQFGGGGGSVDPSSLVQLALAVKSFKIQEKDKKKQEASQRVGMLMSNPQLLLMQDPKEMEKDLKTLGIKVTDKLPANPQDAAKVVTNPGTGDTPANNVNPGNLAAVANATGGSKSGAQAANPASANAAGKAPGGGVTGGIMSPQLVEQMGAKASQRMQEQYGALAPLYAGARSQIDTAQHQAQLLGEIDELKRAAVGGDIRAMARLASIAGHQVTDSDLRNMVIAAGTSEKAVQEAMDVALNNESGADKAKRFASMTKDLLGNSQIMDKLDRPEDAYKIAASVVYSGTWPAGIAMKPKTLAELKQEADYEHQMADDYGTPYDFNHFLAQGHGIKESPSMWLPKSMLGLLSKETISSRKAGASEKQASAALLSAQADAQKATDAHAKIEQTLAQADYKNLNDRLALAIEADKAKHPWPDEVKQALINQVARATGLQPEEVDHWYSWHTSTEYRKVPDSDLARGAAGAGPVAKKPKKAPTLAERGGVVGSIAKSLPKDERGKVITDPGELYMKMDEATRGRALKYLRDILVGIEPEPPKAQ